MKPDPAIKVLLTLAEKDYTAISKMVSDPEFADEIFGFHAQQAVEKAAKALLTHKGLSFERNHDLEVLINMLEENGCVKESEYSSLVDLTDFAVQYRYQAFENASLELDRKLVALEIRKFLDHAQTLCKSPESE
jgi:HEPN domain-containing protein